LRPPQFKNGTDAAPAAQFSFLIFETLADVAAARD
jgi:hypothetical protein